MEKEIKKISIIGLGLIGGSIAKGLKSSNSSVFISAYDKHETLERAYQEKVIDKKLNTTEEALESDLIILALPLEKNLEEFSLLVPKLKEGTVITDVSGIKSPFQKIWESTDSKGSYIGSHPMTGKEKGGFENSDPLLFENSVFIVTENLSDKYQDFKKIIELLGVNILFVPSHQHDVIAASVSHLPQLLAVALVNTASLKTDNYNFLDLAAGGFRDLTRIASSSYEIWDEVIKQNSTQILTALEKFSYELNNVKNWIKSKSSQKLAKYFEEARKNRDEIPTNSKGFLNPIHDIFVFVKDEPGVISKISTKLFEAGINIKDIELLKIREGNGGTFRLSFEAKDIADNAKKLLSDIGFQFK